jgi:hypothetical protein
VDLRFSITDCDCGLRIYNAISGRGRSAVCKTHFSLSKYFAHPFRGIWPMQMFGLPVKDVPP